MTARIDEGFFADVHGNSQWLTLRGDDAANPALLVIGGPGAGCAALAPFFAVFEHTFTLVQWDQPGAGFTFGKNGDGGELTLARLVRDGIRVAEIARERLAVPRLTLLAFSGGTVVGLTMAKARPDLFAAYVGAGQFVDWRAQDALGYARLLERARMRADAEMLTELTAIGPPPYADAATDARKSRYAGAPTEREREAFAGLVAASAAAIAGQPAGASYFAPGVPWPEPRARAFAAYTAMRADLLAFDARRLGRDFALPVVFVQGADDLYSVTAEVQRYAAEIVAPYVEVALVDGAGHSVMLLQAELLRLLGRVRGRRV